MYFDPPKPGKIMVGRDFLLIPHEDVRRNSLRIVLKYKPSHQNTKLFETPL